VDSPGERRVGTKGCRDWHPGRFWRAGTGCQGTQESRGKGAGVGECFHVGQHGMSKIGSPDCKGYFIILGILFEVSSNFLETKVVDLGPPQGGE
jgi:hypothetical protein